MGLLYGEKLQPQAYQKTKQYQDVLKQNATLQLTKLLTEFGDHEKPDKDINKFGTEVEIFIMEEKKFNNKKIYTATKNDSEFINLMKSIQIDSFQIQPEFAKFVKEMVPIEPFDGFLEAQQIQNHFNQVYCTLLKQDQFKILFGSSILPFIGTQKQLLDENNRILCQQEYQKQNKLSKSTTYLDSLITDHSRFKSFTLNTRLRKRKTPKIQAQIYQDINTKIKKIQFDHFGFGMSNCALQVTYSVHNLNEARYLYDQFHVLSPFFLAATATSSVVGNKLVSIDSRFPLIAQSTDDRNPREMQNISKPKYSLINYYISNDKRNKKHYNDKKFTINKKFKKKLFLNLKQKNSKFAKDSNLLNHFAYQFIRDILVIFPSQVKKQFSGNTMDYEAINSCNWNDVRLKPPSNFNNKIGWLVEFRPMDIPITNKEKTAATFFVTLFQRMIVDQKLGVNLYVPISVVDDNFEKSIQKDAFRDIKIKVKKYFCKALHGDKVNNDEIVEVSYKEFLIGNNEFDGIKKLIQKFIELNEFSFTNQNEQEICSIKQIWQVFDFYLAKASGKLMTGAQYIREFVQSHSKYKQDSELSDDITTDLIDKLMEIQEKDESSKMLGNYLDFLI